MTPDESNEPDEPLDRRLTDLLQTALSPGKQRTQRLAAEFQHAERQHAERQRQAIAWQTFTDVMLRSARFMETTRQLLAHSQQQQNRALQTALLATAASTGATPKHSGESL